MQSMVYLLLLATLLGVATADNFNSLISNNSSLIARVNPPIDPLFTNPDYSNPMPLHMPSNNGPMFRSGWEPSHCPQRDRAQKAFLDMEVLAKLSTTYLYKYGQNLNDGSMFTRYFPKDSRAAVEGIILATFFNVQRVGGALLPPQDPSAPRWNDKMKQIDIRYGPLPVGTNGGVYDVACNDPADGASTFLFKDPNKRVIMILCPYAFKQPDLPKVGDKMNCPTADKPYLTFSQQTMANTMFHEFMHANILHDKTNAPSLGGTLISDYDKTEDPTAPADYPPDGYQSWNAMMLAKASRIDPDPTRRTKPMFNADSYSMFAMEVWWSQQCDGLKFEDPPNEDATWVGYIQPDPIP